ncbi:HalX domain-containing protein [Halegenticoccus soli]|uniref:HalX domain-containing protein n=1 Tax=Halegenticoccus soli TaxID=1985678 RepID=UPI001179992A|nr:HalX domain-containing protein [Halegenticoccus soli]
MKGDATVLLVEGEREVAARYARFLDGHAVRTVSTVERAIETIDRGVDVVLLGRRPSHGSGAKVLEAIRTRRLGCRVAVVTVDAPDRDLVPMGFDGHVVRPVARADLRRVVERLLDRGAFDSKLRESAALVRERALLEARRGERGPARDEARADLTRRIEGLQDEIDALARNFGPADYRAAFRDIGRG